MKEQIIKKSIDDSSCKNKLQTTSSEQQINLVCKWKVRKNEIHNGLRIAMSYDVIESIKFQLDGMLPEKEGYKDLLCAKIYETFGVSNSGIAAKAVTDCLNCVIDADVLKKKPEDGLTILEAYGDNVISLFQEMRPKDIYELMIVTKLIILSDISNREFMGALGSSSMEIRTIKQTRGIKLSRLFMEFKEKMDKHRKPEQQIMVQHNHIHNEGHAIIGSQLHSDGGR